MNWDPLGCPGRRGAARWGNANQEPALGCCWALHLGLGLFDLKSTKLKVCL